MAKLAGRHVGQTYAHEDELLDAVVGSAFASCTRSRRKPHLSRTPDRAYVVHRDMGVQRPDRNLVHEQGERLRRDAAAPLLASDPVAEQLLPISRQLPMWPATTPSASTVRTTTVSSARPRPVRREHVLVASGKRRHLDRLSIRLVVKEHVKVPVFDAPDAPRCHVADPVDGRSLLASVLASP